MVSSRSSKLACVVCLFVTVLALHGMAQPLTAPSFMWSLHHPRMKSTVNYQTISLKDMVKLVLSGGGWWDPSSEEISNGPLDLAVVFIGRELNDISGASNDNSDLVDLIKVHLSRSNFSMGFPYTIAGDTDDPKSVSSLLSVFTDNHERVTVTPSCHVWSGISEKLKDDGDSIQEYLMLIRSKSGPEPDTLMVCGDNDRPHSESPVIGELIALMDRLRLRYSFLYVSDAVPSGVRHPSRFLSDAMLGNDSANSTSACDGVCRLRASLLEGLMVGIALLIILISGICCMAGIDAPTRFEAIRES